MKRRFLNAIQKFPKSLNWVKYFFNVHSKNVDDEILLIVKKLENVSCFTSKIRVHRTPNSRCSLYDCSGSFRANIPNINCSCFCVPWCGPWLLALVLSARKRIFIWNIISSGRWKHFWMGVDVELTTGLHLKLTKNVNPNFSFDWTLFITVVDALVEIGIVFS